jgi:hypothetical protein
MCVVGFLLHNSQVSTSKRRKQLRLLAVRKTAMGCYLAGGVVKGE